LPALADPNRPHLFRGKSAGYGAPVTPTLLRPADPICISTVAVSDAIDRPEHVWNYTLGQPR
jgi:hypothetical protein